MKTILRIRYGDEEGDPWDAASGKPCHDCRALPGELHDLGCDAEKCARCRDIENNQAQLIGCWCPEVRRLYRIGQERLHRMSQE